MINCENLINECDKSIKFNTLYLDKIRKSFFYLENIQKLLSDHEESKRKDYKEIEEFNNYIGYMIISLLDLSVISKNLCIAKTDWEKIFFIKHGFLIIHETISRLKPYKNKSQIQKIIESKYPSFNEKYYNALNKIEEFKIKYNYPKIINIRNCTAGHIDEKIKEYYDTIILLNGDEAVKCFIDFLKIIKEIMNSLIEYSSVFNDFLIEENKKIKQIL